LTAFDLKTGERGIIVALEHNELLLKLVEMGCYPGKMIEVVNRSVFDDPICIQVSGYHLLLRKFEADCIKVEYCRQ
jgi:ferrous iron transport protein A